MPSRRLHKVLLVSEILPTYVLVRWRLRRIGLDGALAAARGSRARAGSAGALTRPAMVRLGRGVERTLRPFPFDSRCLSRSLVLIELLARRGVDADLVLAARSKPTFEAHSWVEHDETPLLPTGSGFHRLTVL
jgi:hypothetical protein